MSKPPQRVEDPASAMESMRDAMRKIVTVPKPEILRLEREAKEQRKTVRNAGREK